jgi:3'(2'), 5'-bisphosphate nucleotidase
LDLLEQIGDVAKRAGQEIMNIYETDFAVETKADSSPVTEADKVAETLIIRSIREGITDKFPMTTVSELPGMPLDSCGQHCTH